MGSVYSAYGTFDVPYLVENMPIVCECLVNATKQFQDREKGLMFVSIMLSRLVTDTLDAYRRARDSEYEPYPGIPELLETLKTRMMIFILTDAPLEKTIKRLHDLGLNDKIDGVYGRPQPEFNKLRSVEEIKKKLPNLNPGEMELLLKFHEVHESIPRHNRPEKIEGIIKDIRYQIIQTFDTRKPGFDLDRKTPLQKYETVEDNVMFVGDNPQKDIMQAYNSACYGILFLPGVPSEGERAFMKDLGTDDETVGVNFPEVADLDKVDDSKWEYKTKKREHQRRREKLTDVNHAIQICDRIGQERPDKWKLEA